LLEADATAFERRVLEAALQKRPSPASSARMATALGVSATAMGTAAATKALAAEAAASKATAAAGATAVWPWVSIGVVGLVVVGAVVGTRPGRHAGEPHGVAPSVAAPAAEPSVPTPPAPVVDEPAARAVARSQPGRAAAVTGDLRDQVAVIDSARAAISAGASRRALEILRRYQDKYPTGSFRPEATALKIEALMKLGRDAEARALAERFVAQHRGSLLARRVAEIAGLVEP
jgi:hypothetical protein